MTVPDPPLQPYVPISRSQRKRRMRSAKRSWIMERDGHRCVLCGTDNELTIDHILPLSEGGSDHDSNLRVLCNDCNQHGNTVRRANRELLGWPVDNDTYRQDQQEAN